jgi:hypothetical protein
LRVARARLVALPLALAVSCGGRDRLPPGARIDRALAGGATHAYALAALPGEVVEVQVVERGIHVSLVLETEAGQELLAAADRLTAVAEPPGRYRLTVRPLRSDAAAGRYVLERRAARAAGEADRLRFRAARRMHDGRGLLKKENEDAVRAGESAFEEARSLYEKAGDLPGQFDAVGMMSEARDNLGDMAGSQAFNEQALGLARRAKDPLREADALQWMATAEGHAGRLDVAEAHARAALGLVQRGATAGVRGRSCSPSPSSWASGRRGTKRPSGSSRRCRCSRSTRTPTASPRPRTTSPSTTAASATSSGRSATCASRCG